MSEKVSKNRLEKVAQLKEIVEKFQNAQSVVFVSYSGLSVDNVTKLRKACREADVQYCVLKNRLVGLALKELNITGVDDLLNGPNAFVFSMKDAVAAPKIISEQAGSGAEGDRRSAGKQGDRCQDHQCPGQAAEPRSAVGPFGGQHERHDRQLRACGGSHPQAEGRRVIPIGETAA